MDMQKPDLRFTHLPFQVFPDDNLIIVSPFGDLSFEDLVGHVEDFMAHTDFRSGMHIIYDLSSVTSLDGKLQTLMESAETLSDSEFIPVPAKTVFYVHDNPSLKRLLEGFCIMTRYTRIPHFVTSTINDAFSILELDQKPEHFCRT